VVALLARLAAVLATLAMVLLVFLSALFLGGLVLGSLVLGAAALVIYLCWALSRQRRHPTL
jgi:hypothetical protein